MLLIATEIPAPVDIDMDKYNKKLQKKAERKQRIKAHSA